MSSSGIPVVEDVAQLGGALIEDPLGTVGNVIEEMAKAGKNKKRLATGAQELQRLIDGIDEGAE